MLITGYLIKQNGFADVLEGKMENRWAVIVDGRQWKQGLQDQTSKIAAPLHPPIGGHWR